MDQFLSSIAASFIGSFFGFGFAIVLFLLKEKVSERKKETTLIMKLLDELEYNIRILKVELNMFQDRFKQTLSDESFSPPEAITENIIRTFIDRSFDTGVINSYLGTFERGNLIFIFKHIRWIDNAQNQLFGGSKREKGFLRSDLGLELSEKILENFSGSIECFKNISNIISLKLQERKSHFC